jgi:hypothetical protein
MCGKARFGGFFLASLLVGGNRQLFFCAVRTINELVLILVSTANTT